VIAAAAAVDARAHCVSIDVEDWFQVANFFHAIPRASWDQQVSRVERNVDGILELLAARSVRATFFVLGWIAERHPQVVRRIAAAGHELGSHGVSHRFVQDLGPAAFREEARRSKDLIEQIGGARVRGFRASTFTITRATWWALDVLAEEGYEYDSSVFPVRHPRYGVPGFPPEPQRLELGGARSIVEFPPLVYRRFGRCWPAAGGGYFRLFPLWFSRHAIAQAEREGRSAVLYLHPWEFDPGQPRVAVGRLTRIRHYANLARTAPRLEALLARFRFAAMEDVLAARGLLSPR
jgi:polysaccharide deacetylase family protein (PEP-CTERM system associated)